MPRAEPDAQVEQTDWNFKFIPTLTLGLNTTEHSDMMKDGELITALGVYTKQGHLHTDTGYIPFNQPVRGTPQAAFQFLRVSGVTELILVSTASFYRDLADQWQYVSNGTSTTTTAQVNAGSTAFPVVSSTGFLVNDFIGITLDNGTQLQTQVASLSGGPTINTTDAVPAGRNAPNGTAVVNSVVLTGSLDLQVQGDTLPFMDWFTFTNGVDKPKRYDGTTCVIIPGLPYSGNLVAKALAVFNSSLFLLNTIDNGAAKPQRVWRSKLGDASVWTTGIGDTSGFNDLFDSENPILQANKLGPYLIIYRDASIDRGEYVGTAALMYNYIPVISVDGVMSGASVADMGDFHIVVGFSNIYEYHGGFDYSPLGDKVFYKMFSTLGELNPERAGRTFAFSVQELAEVFIFYCSQGNDIPNKLIRYNTVNESFTEREFFNNFIGFGYFQKVDALTWQTSVGTWPQQTLSWNSVSLQAQSPVILLCDGESGQVYMYDYVSGTDNGEDIPYIVETGDTADPHWLMRFDKFEFQLQGADILIEYSSDEGQTYQQLGTFTQSADEGKITAWAQFVARKIRFRFSGIGPASFDWIYFVYKREFEF